MIEDSWRNSAVDRVYCQLYRAPTSTMTTAASLPVQFTSPPDRRVVLALFLRLYPKCFTIGDIMRRAGSTTVRTHFISSACREVLARRRRAAVVRPLIYPPAA